MKLVVILSVLLVGIACEMTELRKVVVKGMTEDVPELKAHEESEDHLI